MKIWALVLHAAACACALTAEEGPAGEERPTGTIEVTVFNQYVWRGMVVTDGPVLQTASTADDWGFHMTLFTNTDLGSVNQRRGKVSELDFDAGYSRTIRQMTLSGGLVRYSFPNTPYPSTTELYGGIGLPLPLHPAVKVYADLGSIDGAYLTFDVSHALALPRPGPDMAWTVEFSAGLGAATLGYNQGYFAVSRTGLVDFHPAISSTLSISKRWRLTPRAGYGGVVNTALRQSATNRAHGFYGGMSLSFTF